MSEFLLRLVSNLGYWHFFARTPNRLLSVGGKMWTLGPRPPVRCNAPDSLAGQALRSGGALLTGAGLEWSACGIVTSEQTALIADAQSTVGELMDEYRTAHEMYSLASGGQLQHQVFESDGVVVAHDPFMSARQQQLQFDPGQFDEGAFRLGRLGGDTPIEVGDESLLEIIICCGVVANPVKPELLR